VGKLVKLHAKGVKKQENEFSVEKIVNHIREMRIYLKDKWLSKQERFMIQHSSKNVINLDSSDDLDEIQTIDD